MPSTLISIRRPRPPEERRALIEAVQQVLVEVLKTPPQDRNLRLLTFAAEDFAVGPEASADYTQVEITLYPGRPAALKRELYRALVAALAQFGVPARDTRIILNEVAPENWGLRGGIPGSELMAPKALET